MFLYTVGVWGVGVLLACRLSRRRSTISEHNLTDTLLLASPAVPRQHPQNQTAASTPRLGSLGVSLGACAAVFGDEERGAVRAARAEDLAAVGGKTCGALNCSKEPSYGSAGSERGPFCDQQNADGMEGAKRNLCAHSGCLEHRTYGTAGKKWSDFCAEHALAVQVFIPCKEEPEEISSKQLELSIPGGIKTELDSAQASDGMVGVSSGRCALGGCLKKTLFGFEGSERAMFYAEHAVDGMVDIANRASADGFVHKGPSSGVADAGHMQFAAGNTPGRCVDVTGVGGKYASEGDPVAPSCSAAGNWKRKVFASNALDGIVAVASVPCARSGYLNQASSGVATSRPSGVDTVHAVDGVMNVMGAKCRRDGCPEMQSYGVKGSNGTGLSLKNAIGEMEAEPVAVASEKRCLRAGCPMAPTNGLGAGWKAGFCFGHATGNPPNAHGNNCRHEGCFKTSHFGIEGSEKREYCGSHRLDGMVDTRRNRCGTGGCMMMSAYRFEGVKGKWVCAKHAVAGMISVTHHKCANDKCSKQAIFGDEERRSRVFCAEHAQEGMVKTVVVKKCVHKGCRKTPRYGVVGTKSGVACPEHAANGMVDVVAKKCAHLGCSKTPNFGVEGSKKRIFCTQHKLPGMVNVNLKRCRHEGCSKAPSFGLETTKTKEFCAQHKVPGMVNVAHKCCRHEACLKAPSYGLEKSKTREFCAKHAPDGMVSFTILRGNNARRTPKAKVPRIPEPNAEETTGEGASLAEVAGGTLAFL